MSTQDYDELKKKQNNRCAISGRELFEGKEGTHVDHDHETGGVRGLVLGAFNKGLGFFEHSPVLLRSAADYLENPPNRPLSSPSPEIKDAHIANGEAEICPQTQKTKGTHENTEASKTTEPA